MGIYGAINAAVSGLSAQATALENLSGNVANSQTTGYKRLDTTFSDLVSGGGATQASQVSGTSYATSRATNTLQGDISANDVDTYLAINGEGYFVVTKANDVVDGSTTFADTNYYTRAGDFEIDEEGYLVNSSGYYLTGYELDPDTGNAVGDAVSVVKISDQPLAAEATTQVDYQANLPTVPQNEAYDGSDPDTALLDTATVGTDDIAAADEQTFLDQSITGGSITIYNENGTPLNVEIRWSKTLNADPGVPQLDTWTIFMGSGDNDPAWLEIGNVTFDGSGEMDTLTAGDGSTTVAVSAAGNSFEIASITVGDVTAANVEVSFAGGSLTQYSDSAGVASSVSIEQDGYPAGEVTGIYVDEAGRINATYSNSQVRALYEVPLATFKAEQNLQRIDGAAFAATPTSGEADLSGGGSIIANALELSNSDIATEFSKLIITQQAYSANTRVVSAADDMLTDALNMVQ
ncbi:flagellar hook protein FlgE [Roseibium aestuarii]|uniref:Flagellar hook protein FlgE n=1 Tax=Roseibium aestuarii TaxID=2600299 RepID=A0ABW4JXD7_9HYPH|nr:flagellar hook-basal body complex protein [Roseibium aestuarii]